MYKIKKQYRLPGYDYSQSGNYFITIVCKNRQHFLGEIINGIMHLSAAGLFAKENILKFYTDHSLQNPYQNNPYYINQSPYLIAINEFEVLPNHLHLIVEIINKNPIVGTRPVGTRLVGTRLEACSYNFNLHPLVVGSVSSFINHFKGKIKRLCIENNISDFAWQARFNDRIIRDWDEYNRIANYIETNIENWKDDSDFSPL